MIKAITDGDAIDCSAYVWADEEGSLISIRFAAREGHLQFYYLTLTEAAEIYKKLGQLIAKKHYKEADVVSDAGITRDLLMDAK